MEALAALIAAKLTIGNALALLAVRVEQFAMIALVFVPLERLVPFHAKQRLFRTQLVLDLLHYFVGGVFIIVFVWFTYQLMPVVFGWARPYVSPFSLAHLPGWAQFVVFEAGWTMLGYWLHRLMHVWQPLWRLHSLHESPPELDWLSAFRVHPFVPVLFQVFTVMPLWLLEVHQPVALSYTIYAYVLSHVQHANVVFPIGPLKYIFPTPEFHRWHHARIRGRDGTDKLILVNFGQYPIWDLLFGTFYLPSARPTEYGNSDSDRIPTDYLAQLLYPFGWHGRIIKWKRSICDRFGIDQWFSRLAPSIKSIHEALENRLARLSLMRPSDQDEMSLSAEMPRARPPARR
jgi:sterol desaturase/sphingolipid hydroxylase (fatty acid hydroxylase superfamily)